jgi:FkbM family methyltransferase
MSVPSNQAHPSLSEVDAGYFAPGNDSLSELWDQSQMQWQFGDWESLGQLDVSLMENHPRRSHLALLVACACQQLNDHRAAARFVNQAAEWGCEWKLIARLLLAGVHHTLGRAAAINREERRSFRHFSSAVLGLKGDEKLAAQARILRELSRLNLFCNPTIDAAVLSKQALHESKEPREVTSKPNILAEPSQENVREDVAVSSSETRSETPGETAGNDGFLKGIVSYAQNFEDVMLWRALGRVIRGYYIDIGAQHPVVDSVSKAFYEHGWRGIHVEATLAYADLLRQDRPDEKVLQVALSDVHGFTSFYEIPNTGMSTGDLSIAKAHRERGFPFQEIEVPCLTLADVFAEGDDCDVHWLKIDVEGFEEKVLDGWGESQTRPWIVVVEGILPGSNIETHKKWEHYLLKRDYQEAYFDGLSRFYVNKSHPELMWAFRFGPNIFDNYALHRPPTLRTEPD